MRLDEPIKQVVADDRDNGRERGSALQEAKVTKRRLLASTVNDAPADLRSKQQQLYKVNIRKT